MKTRQPAGVFDRSLPMSLLRARESVVLQFRPLLRRHGLNEQQWRVLRVLAEVPGITATGLARQAAVLSPSLSRMLPVLESRGLLRRSPGKDDLRHSVIALEPGGRKLFEVVARDFETIYARMARAFGQQRLQRLHRELEELRTALSEPRPDPPAAGRRLISRVAPLRAATAGWPPSRFRSGHAHPRTRE